MRFKAELARNGKFSGKLAENAASAARWIDGLHSCVARKDCCIVGFYLGSYSRLIHRQHVAAIASKGEYRKVMAGRRIDDIEVLRGIAVAITFYAHVGASLFVWGDSTHKFLLQYLDFWAGVDLFFVISGFVIARDLLPRLRTAINTQDFWRITIAFWIRRAFRILPSAWL